MLIRLIILLCMVLPMATFGQQDKKPVIAVNMDVTESTETTTLRFSIGSAYVDAIAAAGGTPIVLPPVANADDIERYVALADGFVFIGGKDINPARYGEQPHEKWNAVAARREEFDFMLMERAIDANKPVLAICLGMQELNVLHGGTLIQDIPSETDTAIDHRPGASIGKMAHDVEIVPNTRLHALLGMDQFSVNSSHHQACEIAASNAIISARAPDGIIEAIELPGRDFVLGIQWHPERLVEFDVHLKLFRGLVDAARNGMK